MGQLTQLYDCLTKPIRFALKVAFDEGISTDRKFQIYEIHALVFMNLQIARE